jgi:hypothetical protein
MLWDKNITKLQVKLPGFKEQSALHIIYTLL